MFLITTERHTKFVSIKLKHNFLIVAIFILSRKNYVFKSATVKNAQEKDGTRHRGLVKHLIEKNLINTQVPGYFVEIGAHNGTGFTSTLSLDLGWNGLIVEPVPIPFKAMIHAAERSRNKNRQTEVIVSKATISTEPYLNMVNFGCEILRHFEI